MSGIQVKQCCESLGMIIHRIPATDRNSYRATFNQNPSHAPGNSVYWSESRYGGLLGLPRVIHGGIDTHARTIHEIEYLIKGQ